MSSSYHSPFPQKKKAAHRRLTASLLMSLPMKSAVPVRETPPPESPVLTPFSTRKPASVKDFPASRAALLCPGTNRRNLPCQQLEIVLSRDRHVGSNPTVSATSEWTALHSKSPVFDRAFLIHSVIPPLSQKVTLAAAARLQARSQRLRCATNLLRVGTGLPDSPGSCSPQGRFPRKRPSLNY